MRFSHLGILVVDLEKSVDFYKFALGFTPTEYSETMGTTEISAMCGVEGPVESRRQFMTRPDGIIIELRCWTRPEPFGDITAIPMNKYGISHIGFHVDDIDAVSERIVENGGRILSETRTSIGEIDLLFCVDPNGVRIELMRGVSDVAEDR